MTKDYGYTPEYFKMQLNRRGKKTPLHFPEPDLTHWGYSEEMKAAILAEWKWQTEVERSQREQGSSPKTQES